MSLPQAENPLSTTSAGNSKAEVFSSSASITEMEAIAKKLRRHIISMIGKAGSGHPGGSLSAVQKERIKELENAGYRVFVCKGFDDAREQVQRFRGLEMTQDC